MQQVRRAVQDALASRAEGTGATGHASAEVVGAAVRLCYQRLHSSTHSLQSAEQGEDTSVQDTAAALSGSLEALHRAAAAVFVLGPLSGRDAATAAAEVALLAGAVQRIAEVSTTLGRLSSGSSGSTSMQRCLCWLLQALSLALQQLGVAGALSSSQVSSCEPSASQVAVAALAQASLPALHALLLSPASAAAEVRMAALGALFALPREAQAALRLLRCLTAAAGSGVADAAAAGLLPPVAPAQLRMGEGAEGQLLLITAMGGAGPEVVSGQAGSGGGPAAEPPAASLQQQHVQQQALLALLELLGSMAGSYEEKRAAFLQELQAGSCHGQQQRQQQQAQAHKSKAGRPLRPAAEWWVGDAAGGQQLDAAAVPSAAAAAAGEAAKGDSLQASAAPSGGGSGSGGDYMQAEDEAAKHEAAAQRYLDSLLAAGDAPPACYLPLLERLAAAEAAPAAIQARVRNAGWSAACLSKRFEALLLAECSLLC